MCPIEDTRVTMEQSLSGVFGELKARIKEHDPNADYVQFAAVF